MVGEGNNYFGGSCHHIFQNIFRFSFHIKKLKLQIVDHILWMWFSLKAIKDARKLIANLRRAFAPLVSSSANVWWNERFNDTFCGCDNVIVMFGCFKEPLSFRNAVLVSMGCHNKIPQTGWLRQQEFLSHGLREAGSLTSRSRQGQCLVKALSMGD